MILSDQLTQIEPDPASLRVLLLALLALYGELINHLVTNAFASRTAVFSKGTGLKAKAFNAVQFGLAGVWAAEAFVASWMLVSLLTLAAVTLAGPSAVAHSVVEGPTALLTHHTLTG